MNRRLSKISYALLFICLTLVLSGCFEFRVFHVLNYYGNTDEGGYSLLFSDDLLLLAGEDEARNLINNTRRDLSDMSNPTTRYDSQGIYIEDLSGNAAMEHMYDSYNCDRSTISNGRINCRFVFHNDEDLYFPDWIVDWTVVLKPDMRIVRSNHHRQRTENGYRQLTWYFDGDIVSEVDIDFTVNVPIAPR